MLVSALITILIVAVVLWLIEQLPLQPGWLKMVCRVLVVLIAVVALLRLIPVGPGLF